MTDVNLFDLYQSAVKISAKRPSWVKARRSAIQMVKNSEATEAKRLANTKTTKTKTASTGLRPPNSKPESSIGNTNSPIADKLAAAGTVRLFRARAI